MLFVAPCHDFIAATMVSDYVPRRYIYMKRGSVCRGIEATRTFHPSKPYPSLCERGRNGKRKPAGRVAGRKETRWRRLWDPSASAQRLGGERGGEASTCPSVKTPLILDSKVAQRNVTLRSSSSKWEEEVVGKKIHAPFFLEVWYRSFDRNLR